MKRNTRGRRLQEAGARNGNPLAPGMTAATCAASASARAAPPADQVVPTVRLAMSRRRRGRRETDVFHRSLLCRLRRMGCSRMASKWVQRRMPRRHAGDVGISLPGGRRNAGEREVVDVGQPHQRAGDRRRRSIEHDRLRSLAPREDRRQSTAQGVPGEGEIGAGHGSLHGLDEIIGIGVLAGQARIEVAVNPVVQGVERSEFPIGAPERDEDFAASLLGPGLEAGAGSIGENLAPFSDRLFRVGVDIER